MLPPKKWFGTGSSVRRAPPRPRRARAAAGRVTRAPYSPVRIVIAPRRRCASPVPVDADGSVRGARYPLAGAPSTQAKNPARVPGRRDARGPRARPAPRPRRCATMPMPFSCCGQSSYVVAVRGTAGRRAGSTRRPRTRAGGRARDSKRACHASTVSSTASASAVVCGAHLGLGGVIAHPERDDADRGERGEPVEDAEQRVVERGAVVDARAHDDLAVHLDAGVEQRAEPAQARRRRGGCAAAGRAGRDRWRGC